MSLSRILSRAFVTRARRLHILCIHWSHLYWRHLLPLLLMVSWDLQFLPRAPRPWPGNQYLRCRDMLPNLPLGPIATVGLHCNSAKNPWANGFLKSLLPTPNTDIQFWKLNPSFGMIEAVCTPGRLQIPSNYVATHKTLNFPVSYLLPCLFLNWGHKPNWMWRCLSSLIIIWTSRRTQIVQFSMLSILGLCLEALGVDALALDLPQPHLHWVWYPTASLWPPQTCH